MGTILRTSWLKGMTLGLATFLVSLAHAATNYSILATSMTKEVGGPITIAGLASHNLWSNGSVYSYVSVPTSGSHTIKVRAYGQAAGGVNPNMQLLVDNVVVKSFSVTNGAFNEYSHTMNLNAGNRKVNIKFTNDYYYNGQDRNLIVYNLVVNSNATSTPAPSPSPSPTPTATAAPVTGITKPVQVMSSAVSKTSLSAGETLTASAVLGSSTGQSNLIVDLRLVDAADKQVARKEFSPTNISANGTVNLSNAFSTTGLAAGTYRLVVGVWTSSWSTLLYEHRNSFTVGGTSAPAPTPTPSATAAPAPSPTPTQAAQSADGTLVPPAARIVDASGAIYTISSSQTVLRNGAALGFTANVSLLIYKSGRVYQQNTAGGFWYWDGGTWVASSDPRGGTAPAPSPTPTAPPSGGTGSITMPMTNPMPPDSISMTCVDAERQFAGSFYVENNKWGAAGAYPNHQCAGIGRIAADGSVSARWTWNYGTSANEVKGYPSISYGQRPGYPKSAGSVLPKVVNTLSHVQFAWNSSVSGESGKGHNAFDIWLTQDGVDRGIFFNNLITHELMISTNNWGTYGDYPNPAWLYESEVVIDGKRFRVTKADNFPPGGVGGRTWRFVVFKMLEDRPVGSVNFMAFIQYLKSKGLISGNEYMNSIEFGTEPEHGTGDVKIHGYKIEVR